MARRARAAQLVADDGGVIRQHYNLLLLLRGRRGLLLQLWGFLLGVVFGGIGLGGGIEEDIVVLLLLGLSSLRRCDPVLVPVQGRDR